MKILVLDYARDSGGAYTISEYINHEVINDKDNTWLWITSDFDIKTKKNIYNLKLSFIKKNLFNRLIFEKFYAKKIVKDFKPDLILSLQNLGLGDLNIPQVLYIHQAIPFIDNKIVELDGIKKKIKMNIIKKLLNRDLKNAEYIIVQTKYMKNLLIEYNDKIVNILPSIFLDDPEEHCGSQNFIYPTNSEKYKNFNLIIKVAEELKAKKIPSTIFITLQGDENDNIKSVLKQVNKESLPIKFIGTQSKDSLKNLYRKNNLIFTSKVESLGLPLLEGMHYGCKILALETEFAKEVLENYDKKYLFTESSLSNKIKELFDSKKSTLGKNIESFSFLETIKKEKIID
ncbi:glycosyltransferase [Macrococcoides bohemicum]|uniref:glycosyltransferase n=1 Tax=Macrococcoides bohemicum TaxID=1903056 RepID=UPI003B00AFCA